MTKQVIPLHHVNGTSRRITPDCMATRKNDGTAVRGRA